MERRRKKPSGFLPTGYRGRHADAVIFEDLPPCAPLDATEYPGETDAPRADTLVFPVRRAPAWVTLGTLTAAALVVGVLVGGARSGDGERRSVVRQSAELPAVMGLSQGPAATVTVPGPTVRVTLPVPAATAQTMPVPGPTITRTMPVPGPTVTRTMASTPAPCTAPAAPETGEPSASPTNLPAL